MHRNGADPTNMQPGDFICDFCLTPWDGTFPMVEGHKGSLICGQCLSVAFAEAATSSPSTDPASEPRKCTMCLAEKDGAGWASPLHDAWTCVTCIKRGSGKLHKDPDWDWRKPTGSKAMIDAVNDEDD